MSLRILISPAKKMRRDTDSLAWRDLPAFLPQTRQLLARLRQLTAPQLQELWKCSDPIARQNLQRLEQMELERGLSPAILAYEGIQYRYMAPGVFTDGEFAYVQEHLRIVSGFYGLLRPLDGVQPYRLEMQARLQVEGAADLYAFWGERLAGLLRREADCLIDLASREYSSAVTRYLPAGFLLLRCRFVRRQGDKLLESGTLCKMARGEMVRYMAEGGLTQPRQLQGFERLGFAFRPELSREDCYVFLQNSEKIPASEEL